MIQKHNRASLAIGLPGFCVQVAGVASGSPGLQLLGSGLFLVGLGFYAAAKGRSPAWCLLAFFSVIGFIVLALLEDRSGVKDPPRSSLVLVLGAMLLLLPLGLIALAILLPLVRGKTATQAEAGPPPATPADAPATGPQTPATRPKHPAPDTRPGVAERPAPPAGGPATSPTSRHPERPAERPAPPRPRVVIPSRPLRIVDPFAARIERTPAGGTAVLSLRIEGHALDAEGRTDLLVDLTVLDARGQAVFERASVASLRRHRDEGAGAASMAWEVSIELLATIAAGDGEVWVIVRDRIRNEKVFRRSKVKVG